MIENIGIGIDIVDIDRFREIPYGKKSSFYDNIFDKNEIEYCLKFNDPYPHFAGKFAVKEAVIKSIKDKIKITDIKTKMIDSKPEVELLDKYSKKYSFKISISHEKDIAIGMAISEKII